MDRRGEGTAARAEIGWHQVEVTPEGATDPLLGSLAPFFEAFQWHSYEFPLPPDAVPIARSEVCLQGARIGERAWALQSTPRSPVPTPCTGSRTALGPETEAKIGAFNQFGRDLCLRWLRIVA